MASANALMHHRRLQRLKKSSQPGRSESNNSVSVGGNGSGNEVRIAPAEESSDSGKLVFCTTGSPNSKWAFLNSCEDTNMQVEFDLKNVLRS